MTRLSDREDPVADEIWDEAARHYDEAGLAALLIAIGTINVWNRFNVATRQVAGQLPAGWRSPHEDWTRAILLRTPHQERLQLARMLCRKSRSGPG